jgi:UDP-glucose 4-epimerase
MTARAKSAGQVFNVGADEEISIHDLARRIVSISGSTSAINLVPYSEAYGDGFEDMRRRVPSIEKIGAATGWKPSRKLDDVIRDVIAYEQA